MNKTFGFWIVIVMSAMTGCEKNDETKDTEKPVIDMTAADAFPAPCDTLNRGEQAIFRATFSDNVELGSFNLELHHNFDHHTHGSHSETCPTDPDSEPVNPFYFNENYSIPGGLQSYQAEAVISIPGDVDSGDYHFVVKVTDAEGWQSWQSVSLKIL